MSQKLVSHNDDLRRLVERGCAVGFDGNYLIIRDVPYLDNQRVLQWGAIVTKMQFPVDNDHAEQEDHQVFFAGGLPHALDGNPIPNLGSRSTPLALTASAADVVVRYAFSHKPLPAGKYTDFFHKVMTYVTVISGPAIELHGANPFTYRCVAEGQAPSPFKFRDTLTSRAEIGDLSAKFNDETVAVIGLGGTGAYVLDFLVKTPVKEIRGFDGDLYHIHNAFRSPGKLDPAELGTAKADVYQGRYDNFRTGLTLRQKFIDATCADDVAGVTFAFVCVDKGSSRAGIFELLLSRGIPFIDVGMGLKRKTDGLSGMIRTTHYSVADGPKLAKMGLAELSDTPEDLYRTNVQIAELNALNAALAVIRFKQLRGFYVADSGLDHVLFALRTLRTLGLTHESAIDEAAAGPVHPATA